MPTTPLDPEDALDLLGIDDAGDDKSGQDVLDVEFPPINPVKPGATPSAAAFTTAVDADLKNKLAAAQKAKEKAEAEKATAERALKTAQDRTRVLETDLATARAAGAGRGTDAGIVKERDALRAEVEHLRAQVAGRGGKVSLSSLPGEDEEAAPLPKEGQLEQVPYGRILVRMLRDHFTGRLAFKTGTAKREVYFEDGAPVAYSSSEPGERLGRVLVTQGRITEEQYLAAARAMVERGAKLTEALLEMGAIDADRLQNEQRQLTRDQIISGFALTQGSYVLETGKTPPDEVGRFEFKAGEIYLQGYRKYVPESEIKALYSSIKDAYVRPRSEFSTFRPHLGMDQDDERILKMLGEAYTVEEAVDRSGVAAERGARLLGALKLLGLISEWKPGVAEFEARLKAEKLRQAEEALALKQKLQEREEQLFNEVQKTLQRIEASIKDVARNVGTGGGGGGGGGSAGAADMRAATPSARKDASPAIPAASNNAPPPQPSPPASEPVVDAVAGEDGPGHEKYKEGMRQAAAGRLDEAETALREAVRLDATRPAYLTALARVLLANPRYERAGTLPVVRSLLDRAQALAPGDAEVSALLQRIQQEMG
jgi:tetratricopeptide (TPR) repeat protein